MTVTISNRLSLENSLLRAGYWQAESDLDFWTNLDNPLLPDAQRPLKSIGHITDWTDQGHQHGLPFTPMYAATNSLQSAGIWVKGGTVPRVPSGGGGLNTIMPRPSYTVLPLTTSAQTTDSWENDTGWDTTFSWAPHDPRTWSRANMAEKDRDGTNELPNLYPPMINGRYAIFGYTNPGSALLSYQINPDHNVHPALAPITVTYAGYPTGGIHTWYYKQLNSLIYAMGYAAFCDYLPANAIYTWYGDTGDRTAGGINKFGISPNYNFCNWDGDVRTSRGVYLNTYASSFGYPYPFGSDDYGIYPTPSPARPAPGSNNLHQWFYHYCQSDYGAWDNTQPHWNGVDDLQWFLRHVNYPLKLMAAKPTDWPDVSVSVGRLIKNAHFVNIAKVRRTSALNGETIELSWCGLGTTLRGARQQRLRDASGWAAWDNAPGATNDPNLDSP